MNNEGVEWDKMSQEINHLSDQFIIDHITQFDWRLVPASYNFSEHIVRECKDRINPITVALYAGNLSDGFLREIADWLVWDAMACYAQLSEEMIRENHARFQSWDRISLRKLSDEFIRDFADRLNWKYVVEENHSLEILTEHFDRIRDWRWIYVCPVSNDIIDVLMQKNISILDWSQVSKCFDLSEEIIAKYQAYIDWYAYAHNPYASPKIVYQYTREFRRNSKKMQCLIEKHQLYLDQVDAARKYLPGIIPDELTDRVIAYL